MFERPVDMCKHILYMDMLFATNKFNHIVLLLSSRAFLYNQ